MLGKKTEEKKELEEKTGTSTLGTAAPPPCYVSIKRVENGCAWVIQELHSHREAYAQTWQEALAWATEFSGEPNHITMPIFGQATVSFVVPK